MELPLVTSFDCFDSILLLFWLLPLITLITIHWVCANVCSLRWNIAKTSQSNPMRDWCGKSLLDPKSPQQWIFQVCQYERLVVCGTTLEEATQRGPGLVFVLPFLETATLVDIRVKVFEVWWFRWTVFLSGAANVKIFVFSGDQVPSQQILTTDSVTLTVDAVVYYRLSWSLFKESFS